MGIFGTKPSEGKAGRQRADSVTSGPMLSVPERQGPAAMAPPSAGQSTYAQQRREVTPPSSHKVSESLETMRDRRGLSGVGGAAGMRQRVQALGAGMARGAVSGQQSKALELLTKLTDVAQAAFGQSCDAVRANDKQAMHSADHKMTQAVAAFTALADKTEQYKLLKQGRRGHDAYGLPNRPTDAQNAAYPEQKAEFAAELARAEAVLAELK